MRSIGALRGSVLAACCCISSFAQTSPTVSSETRNAVSRLVGEIMVGGKAYDYDRRISDDIGPRLTGSDNYVHAVKWAVDEFKTLGLSNVHTEPFTMKATWEPEVPAVGKIVAPREQILHLYSLGWSPSTPESGVKGEVIYPKHFTIDEIDAQKQKIAGSIVLFDMDSLGPEPAFSQILKVIDHLNGLHPQALLYVGGANGSENATALSADGSISPYPVAQVGLEDELLIKRLLEKGPVTIEFSYRNKIRKDVKVDNVVAEIPGRELPNEYVIVAGHLDSWHPAQGSQDNGTGVATVLDIARAVKAIGRPPRRTLRFILFGGEEQGMLGSIAYAKQHANQMSSIDTVLISDTGAQPARGWYVMGRNDEERSLADIEPLLKGLGSDKTTESIEFLFQTDHIGFDVQGVPTLVLWNDVDKYFKLHHKASDSFDSVVEQDLNQGVATTAVTAYAIADAAEPFAAHDTPAQVEQMLKNAGQWDDYQVFKSMGLLP